jgi:hypothetical protein
LVEPPSFQNINDFIGVFLPGYVAVTLYLWLFHYNLVFGGLQTSLSFDLFSAVVFIVAGPTVGITLKMFHRQIFAIASLLHHSYQEKRSSRSSSRNARTVPYLEIAEAFSYIRLKATDSQKVEIDRVEAVYDFCISTTIAILTVGTYHIFFNRFFDATIQIPIYVLSIVLLSGGILQYRYSYRTAIEVLNEIVSEDSGTDERVKDESSITQPTSDQGGKNQSGSAAKRIRRYTSEGKPINE